MVIPHSVFHGCNTCIQDMWKIVESGEQGLHAEKNVGFLDMSTFAKKCVRSLEIPRVLFRFKRLFPGTH